ncbi:DUF3047 domain-containing protein [Salinarimonas ramus]|uniref:DUF3047 domain-containing protein n=1 Tax=Salinarimonas ramus TaxID=690164 RepID=A0A917Q497_9HYPH|nr:DUF3047 domain-containing protein [Salinarimonas ramus]GGK23201.1 hypothetical protein GCM10011322_07430 [Salinarimonas ramus]
MPTARTHRALLGPGLLALSLALAAPAAAQTAIPFGPDLESAGWDAITFRGIPATTYAARDADTLDVVAEGSSSVIAKRLPPSAFDATAASWRWRVEEGPPATDLARRGGDDRALALYFAFAPEGDRASAEAGRSSLRSLLLSGRGRLLVYVFGGVGTRGQIVENPYARGRGVYVIRRPADAALGTWHSEEVDLAADHRAAFGEAPGILVGLAVASDSDDTGGRNVGVIEGVQVR